MDFLICVSWHVTWKNIKADPAGLKSIGLGIYTLFFCLMRNQRAQLFFFCIHGMNSHGFCGKEEVKESIFRFEVLDANVLECSHV